MDHPVRPPARHAHACSCEVLVEIAHAPEVAALLAAHGVDAAALGAARAAQHASLHAEPGDWRARLPKAVATEPVQRLLAIVRSADCHGYQLLETAGVDCPTLRRHIVDGRAPGGTVRASRAERVHADRPRPDRLRPDRPRTIGSRGLSPANPRVPAATARVPRLPALRSNPIAPSPRASTAAVAAVHTTSATSVARSPEPSAAAPPPLLADAPPPMRALDPSSLPPLFGRDRELAALGDALGRRAHRPVLLLGPSGCGRTLLASHLAATLDGPTFLLSALDYAEDDDHALRRDLEGIHRTGGHALFDDFDRVVLEAAPCWLAELTQAWVRDQPRLLPMVSAEGLGRLAQWIPGVLEGADVIRVESLEGPALGEAVTAAATSVLAQHRVTLDGDLRASELARLSDRFLTGLAQPGRAIDLLDLACARTRRGGASSLDRASLHALVAERAQLPLSRIAAQGDQDVLELETRLATRVVGHIEPIRAIAQLVRRNRAGLGGGRPILGALLLGPSGVGKTELAKALAWALFERDDALVRLDMSEYAEPHTVARIVGAPPGYVGYEQGGALTEPLLRHPHTVVLLDEIEKAHRDVHQLLLQILDEGRLTDGRGRTIDFRHAAILMTSNLGAQCIRRVGGRPRMDDAAVLDLARGAFPVELWNRIEAPLVMQPLGSEDLRRICRKIAKASSDRLLHERGVRYALSEAACELLVVRAGIDPDLGARPLRHLLGRELDPLVADAVLRGRVRAGDSLTIEVDHGRLVAR